MCHLTNACVTRDLEEALEMGMDWSLREGYAWAEDKEHCEEYGRMLQADPNKVSSKAKKRGLPQVALQLTPVFTPATLCWCLKLCVCVFVAAWHFGSRKPLC